MGTGPGRWRLKKEALSPSVLSRDCPTSGIIRDSTSVVGVISPKM
jgi:hypothetical protein